MTFVPHPARALPSGPFDEFLGDLASLGVMPVIAGGIAYGMMRARTNARWWLLPTARGPASSASLAMYQPVSASARMARMWVATALRFGLTSGWASGRINFDRLPRLPGLMLPRLASCAYFTGTDGPHRKTAIQLMDGHGGILGYAKLSRRAAVRPYLTHEARMLTRVGRLGLTTAAIPDLLAYQDRGGDVPAILVTDSRKTSGVSSPPDPAGQHLRFLAEMVRRTGRSGASRAYRSLFDTSNAPGLPNVWRRRFRLGFESLAPFAPTMPVALAHGDFTPWNSFIEGDGLYVFDWEYAVEDQPVGYDLTHYLLAGRGAREPGQTADRLVGRVAATHLRGDLSAAGASVLMSLLLHAGFYLRRSIENGGDGLDWAEGPDRGRLVDVLLDRVR